MHKQSEGKRTEDDLLACAIVLRAERRMRQSLLGAELFADPAWDIMLDLFIAECRGVSLLETALCGVLPDAGTGLRSLVALEANGHVTRSAADGPQGSVQLSEQGRQTVRRHLLAVIGYRETRERIAA
ncbi:hypothetical protein ACFSCW_14325 [Sphingomonas tabacisoli]|uniref:MarR family transcriptional regulator n=1 Tax=Sphingomonas tabacisoli TaxID=2249466 RepID=A0ABW4I6G2_9SPHN